MCIIIALFLDNSVYAAGRSFGPHIRPNLQFSTKEGKERSSLVTLEISKNTKRTLELLAIGILAGFVLVKLVSYYNYNREMSLIVSMKEDIEEANLEAGRILQERLKTLNESLETIKQTRFQFIEGLPLDVSGVKTGDINLLLCKHGSEEDFMALVPFLDKIFEKARKENKKIIWYTENSVPTTTKEVKMAFPDLDVERIFKEAAYKKALKKDIIRRHNNILTFCNHLASGAIPPEQLKYAKIDSMWRFDFFRDRYVGEKGAEGYNVSLIPEQPSFDAYILGLKRAIDSVLIGDVTKNEIAIEKDLRRKREEGFASLISETYDKDAYIIVMMGMLHVGLNDILQSEKELPVNPYIPVEALRDVYGRSIIKSLDSLKVIQSFM